MKIHLATHYGLCFGVRDAIAMAEDLTRQGPLVLQGQLVHNPVVREQLARRGVREIERANHAPRILISAHGVSERERSRLQATGARVYDATCPLVHHAHAKLKDLVGHGFHPVVIGQAGHVEIRGLTGDYPQAVVVEQASDLDGIPNVPRIGVVAQTTQPLEKVLALVTKIRRQRPEAEVRFEDTVCRPTKQRQAALEDLLGKVEAVVVVGGFNSNNTGRLLAKVRAAGLPAWQVEQPDQLQPEWFHGIRHLGLTAGTSTLPETVEAVREAIEKLTAPKRSQPEKTR